MNLDLYGGPGGWDVAAEMLGLGPTLGVEWDAAACRTRAAAGHLTVRADVSQMPAEPLAGKVEGIIGSPPCTTFSGAGSRAGAWVVAILAEGVADAFAGRKTRARTRREMARALRAAGWPKPPLRPSKYAKGHKLPVRFTRAEQSARIRAAVLSASQVLEPARFIHACCPEWVALEQVPEVLPLWKVYAAELRKMGYSAWCGKLNAANYGVPQTRERAILIASRMRRVGRPAPTHYDPRKGDQLWGTPWVSMAEALGWGATGRAAPTVTAGGTATGGAEPFGHRDRDMLAAEQDAGRWALRRSRGEGMLDREGKGGRRDHPLDEPAPTITGAGGKPGANLTWVLRHRRFESDTRARGHARPDRMLHNSPAITLSGSAGRALLLGQRSHTSLALTDSMLLTVEDAAVLQSFPANYPWQGSRTKCFQQIGNAIPPLLAAHVLAMATGISIGKQAAA